MNVIDITNPLEKKRQTYLTFYKDGIYDGILNQKPDPRNASSAYYKKGFDDGLKLLELIEEYNIGE
tara:strand:- start:920 stop:1117 length:198 start_codon:yes stop_codon:yes gene_type:complete